MLYKLFIAAVFLIHVAYILFVLFGSLLIFKYKQLVWLHIPCLLWALLIVSFNAHCPLTALEKWLRMQAHLTVYGGGFIPHYFGFTAAHPINIFAGLALVVFNIAVYWLAFRKK